MDSLDVVSGFGEWYYNLCASCRQKNRSSFVVPQIKTMHSSCNTLHHPTYYKQSYCKEILFYTILCTDKGQLQGKRMSCRTKTNFVISNVVGKKTVVSSDREIIIYLYHSCWAIFTTLAMQYFHTKFTTLDVALSVYGIGRSMILKIHLKLF